MVDWNDWFSYDTVKIVRVHDKRLGLLHYAFMVAIFAYIVGYTIVWEQRYVLTGAPVGSVRLTLLAPRERTNASELDYCKTPEHPRLGEYENYDCLYWDESFVMFPPVEDHDVFVTTRVNITNQALSNNCSLTDPSCKYDNESPDVYYIADVEKFTLMIDHTVFVPDILSPTSSLNLTGQLTDQNGNVMKLPQDASNHIGIAGQSDIVEIGTLLRAAGVDLDGPAETKNKYGNPVTRRFDGLVLVVFIDYSNLVTYNLHHITYSYRVTKINGAKFTVDQPIYTKNVEKRQVWDRHGVRIILLHTGAIGKFDAQTLLLSLVGGLGLMAVATFIVDTLATRVLPAKKVYNRYKFDHTKDIKNESVSGVFADVTDSTPIGARKSSDASRWPEYNTFSKSPQ